MFFWTLQVILSFSVSQAVSTFQRIVILSEKNFKHIIEGKLDIYLFFDPV